MLLQAIQPYANGVVGIAISYNAPTHPYFPNGDGEVTDEEDVSDNRYVTMLKAACNDQDSLKDPGTHAPVIIPGGPENSLLAQKMIDAQSIGDFMPPAGLLPEDEIQIILDWIEDGALDNYTFNLYKKYCPN